MDLQKSKLLLDKINALFKNMSADSKNISGIEIDLMRSYIRQLYEVFIDMPQSDQPAEPPAVEIIKSRPPVTGNQPEPKTPEPAPEPVKPAREEPPVPPVVKKEPTASPAPEPKPAPPPAPRPAPVNVENKEELEELFAFTSARELSEKLGEMPITDIRKAMGLNERIFTMNELFGGDQGIFDLTLETLNKLPNFSQAKTFLINNAASKYSWNDKAKRSKAKNFIKLVKRRYNN